MRPYSVRFLGNHRFRRLFKEVSFCSKFFLYAISSSCEKLIPRASVEFAGQAIPSGVVVFVLLDPSHIPSVLLLLISNPEHCWNFVSKSNKFVADFISETKAVVSSAYWDSLNSLLWIFIPVMFLSFLIALAKISARRTNRVPKSGQPCPPRLFLR